jgi:signal transduction histidine kinase
MSADNRVNILVVDDQPAKLLSYEVILNELGEQLLKANSAQEAFEHLLRSEVAVALIDVSMPDLDGYELATMIRNHPRFQTIAIIFVSAIALTDLDRVKGYEHGAVDYVPVPVVPELLRAKVRVHCDLYRKTRQLERLNVELERRVEERTAELAQANADLERRVEERTREREAALAQVHEMQKLESLGQLTGGVAHDFNNVLMAVLGNLELVEARLTDDRLRRMVQNARRAGQRGAKLTEQLLAYARRQRLTPEPTDLNRLLGPEPTDMLRRALGGTVEVKTKLAPDLWAALADPTQLDLIVLNLAINARDAMPEGGTLLIETANVPNGQGDLPSGLPAGDYVMVSVTDNGTGMSEEVAAKAFEPFFSTKEPGKGSGLGLSQVYGVTRQLGGAVHLRTKEGQGTCVEIFLPRTNERPSTPHAERSRPSYQSASATVLVVDDQEEVREVSVSHVETLGYRAIPASSGKGALDIFDGDAPIDLLLADFAMPGMSGIELARIIRRKRPDLPVVIVTGYAEIGDTKDLEGMLLLKKPYRLDDLAATIENALGGRRMLAAAASG